MAFCHFIDKEEKICIEFLKFECVLFKKKIENGSEERTIGFGSG